MNECPNKCYYSLCVNHIAGHNRKKLLAELKGQQLDIKCTEVGCNYKTTNKRNLELHLKSKHNKQ